MRRFLRGAASARRPPRRVGAESVVYDSTRGVGKAKRPSFIGVFAFWGAKFLHFGRGGEPPCQPLASLLGGALCEYPTDVRERGEN